MREERCVVYAHGNDWDGVRSRQRYLMEALSQYIPVVYLDGSSHEKGQGRVTLHNVTDRVTVMRGLMRPMVSLKLRKFERPSKLWGWWHTRWIRKKYRKIIFIDSENWLRPYRFIPHDKLVFDCIDPCFDRSPRVMQEFEEREIEVLKASSAVFVTAEALVDFAKKHNSSVYILNNACAPSDYAPELVNSSMKPVWWPGGNKKIAAYLGAIDWRFDFDFAVRAAEDHPAVDFVFAGNILGEIQERSKKLASLPNVCMPGRISVEEGRFVLAHCDIGLIPFTTGEMNDAINPVKMYAYCYLGKPIAGSAVRELTIRPEIVDTGATPQEFSTAVTKALERSENPVEKQKLMEFARANTWEKRAEEAWKVIQKL